MLLTESGFLLQAAAHSLALALSTGAMPLTSMSHSKTTSSELSPSLFVLGGWGGVSPQTLVAASGEEPLLERGKVCNTSFGVHGRRVQPLSPALPFPTLPCKDGLGGCMVAFEPLILPWKPTAVLLGPMLALPAPDLCLHHPAVSLLLCRWVKQESEFAKQAENPEQTPKLDLGFKEGQTIKLSIAVRALLQFREWKKLGVEGAGTRLLVGSHSSSCPSVSPTARVLSGGRGL